MKATPLDTREKYNIALVPSSMDDCQDLWNYAAQWTQTADGYLISHKNGYGVPHITLSRFYAPKGSETSARAIAQNAAESIQDDLEVPITELAIAVGKKPEEKNRLLWFNAVPFKKLMLSQEMVVRSITARGFEPSALDTVYQPHLTVCIAPEQEIVGKMLPPGKLLRPYKMKVCLGRSGTNGMLMDVIEPSGFAALLRSTRERCA